MQNLRLSDYGVAAKNASNELLNRNDAIELGGRLFNDAGMSASGQVACATCHQPEYGYQDANLATFRLDPNAPRRASGLLGVALQDWFFLGRSRGLALESVACLY
jgi:cytochrome c peroxidase